MIKSEKMKYKLAEAIKEVMHNKPLDKITVSDIVEVANTTRQSFYRHFQDKYDLVNWYFERLAEKSFKLLGVQYTLKEGLIKKFEFIKEEENFFRQAFLSKDQNSLMRYDFECILQFYIDYIEKRTHQKIDEEVLFVLELYCEGSIQMTMKWITQGCQMPTQELVELLIEAMPEKLKNVIFDEII